MIRLAFVILFLAAGASAQTPEVGLRDAPLEPAPAPPPDPRPVLMIEVVGTGSLLVNGVLEEIPRQISESTTPTYVVRRAVGDTVRVSLVEDLRAWDARRTDATVVVTDSDRTIRLQLPVRTRVETLPLGADLTVVYASGEHERLGPGPATIDLAAGTMARVTATLDGHLDAAADLPSAETVTLILRPVGQPEADPVTLLPMRGSTRTRTLIDIGIGAAAAVAGAVAVHYKFRADDLDDQYRDNVSARRGDPALLAEINRNDTYSNIALAGMQVGLGVLAVRFILR